MINLQELIEKSKQIKEEASQIYTETKESTKEKLKERNVGQLIITVAIGLVFSIIIYLLILVAMYVFRDRTEEIRLERYTEAQKQYSEYADKEQHFRILKEYAEKCMKANSQTGVLANCEEPFQKGKVNAEEAKVNTGTIQQAVANVQLPLSQPKGWLKNSQGESKSRDELKGNTFDEISRNSGISPDYWYEAEKKWKIKKEVALCIAWADSGLGAELKSTNNIGNVGNNDRGDVVHYKTQQSGVEAIFRVLNNKYLSHKQSIGSLSVGGGGNSPYYATSPDNWDKNTRNCLSVIHGVPISKDFKIRL